jgi:hypothetical protein
MFMKTFVFYFAQSPETWGREDQVDPKSATVDVPVGGQTEISTLRYYVEEVGDVLDRNKLNVALLLANAALDVYIIHGAFSK